MGDWATNGDWMNWGDWSGVTGGQVRSHTTDAQLLQEVLISPGPISLRLDVFALMDRPAAPVLQSQGPPSPNAANNLAGEYKTRAFRKAARIVER